MKPRGVLGDVIRTLGLEPDHVPEQGARRRAARHPRQHEVGRRVGGIQGHAPLQHPYALVRSVCFPAIESGIIVIIDTFDRVPKEERIKGRY